MTNASKDRHSQKAEQDGEERLKKARGRDIYQRPYGKLSAAGRAMHRFGSTLCGHAGRVNDDALRRRLTGPTESH